MRPPVLVVEPNGRTRSIIQTMLGRKGFRVVAAGSADEGLSRIASEPMLPELVVAEARLEGSDGFALCNRLRKDRRTAQVPVILMSRSAGLRQEELATQAGADDFVAKPTFANDLVSLVQLRAGSSFGETEFRETTAELPLPVLLRALLAGVRSGRIEMTKPAGRLCFRHGGVVDASFGRTRDADALVPLLLLADGEYRVSFSRTLVQGVFYLSLKELCSSVLPAVRRWQQFIEGEPAVSARLVVDFLALRSGLTEIPQSAYRVLRLFDGRRTVRQAVLDSTLPEDTSLAVIWRLFKTGVLVKPTTQAAIARPSTPGSKLFLGIRAKSTAETLGLEYEPLQNVFLPAGVSRPPRPASVLRSALHAVFAIIAVVGIAAGAGWVVSRGEIPKFFARHTSLKASVPPVGALGSIPEATHQSVVEQALEMLATRQPYRAVELLSPLTEPQPSSSYWFLLGVAKFEAGDSEGARRALSEALRLNPRNGLARMLLVTVYFNEGEATLASAELQRYLELEPNGPYAAQARQLLSAH